MIRRFLLLAELCCVTATPAWALDCENPMTQRDMNHCAYLDYQAADEDLNLAYGMPRGMADRIGPHAVTKLRDAQRAWITFRDLACEVEGLLFEGGTMEPLIVDSCKAGLSRQRTEQLRYFAEVN